MAKRILFCPKCMNRIHKSDTKCSNCGLTRAQMEEMMQPKPAVEEEEERQETASVSPIEHEEGGGIKIDTNAIMSGAEIEEKAKDEPVEHDEIIEPDVEEGIASEDVGKVVYEKDAPKRHSHKKKRQEVPDYSVDENGEYNIDTRDVTFLEGVEAPTYSVKKARGEVKEEKLKWWEIYKWADRMLAKRKINKEVKKASHKIPFGISKVSMIILCLLFGWMGAHDFYAKNYKKGTFVLVSFTIAMIVVNVDVLARIMGVFVGGGLGFIVLALWLTDLVAIILNKYGYRISKEEFIANLNVETRAKLGKKYVNMDRASFRAKEKARQDKIINKKNKKHRTVKKNEKQ